MKMKWKLKRMHREANQISTGKASSCSRTSIYPCMRKENKETENIKFYKLNA